MAVRVVRSNVEHAELIATKLRSAPPEQIELMGLDSVGVISQAIIHARHCWSGFWNDDIACILGVQSTTMLTDTAYLWIVTTPVVDEHPFLFARYSKMFIKELLNQEYVAIMGCVDPKYDKAMKWVKWLGFEVVPMPDTDKYFRFEMRRAG